MMSSAPAAPALPLHAPAWLTSAVFAAVVTALATAPVWPGFMSFDSLYAYEQGLAGVQTMLWPPMHAYMFALSRALGADTWGVLVLQTFTLFLAAALILHILVRNRRLALLLCIGFALSFVYFPTLAGTVFVQWRDVPTASFAFLGLALWLIAARRGSVAVLATAAVSFGVATALRYNALPLVAFAILLMAWSPFLGRPAPARARAILAATLALSLGLAWASTQWRLPDLLRVPKPDNFAGTQLFDLIGISACADRNYLPAAVTAGAPVTGYQLRKAYDPRHLLITLQRREGTPRLAETDAGGQVQKLWPRLIRQEPGCYVSHRLTVFVEQIGLARESVFYPTHSTIDQNRFGLELAHPKAAAAVGAYVARNASEPWRRPALIYLGALAAALAAMAVDRRYAFLLLALLAGCFAYLALLFVAAPAADARYIFPPNVLAVLVGAISVGVLAERIMARRAARDAAA